MEVRALILISVFLFMAACGRNPQGNAVGPADPLATAPRNHLVVTTTDFKTTGKLAIVDLTRSVAPLTVPVHSDAVARAPIGSRYVYAVNRLLADNIQVIEKATGKVVSQYSVGPSTNPQDIVVIDDHLAYVPRLAASGVLKFDPLTGKSLGMVSGFDADSDGSPDLAWALRIGNKILVEEQRLVNFSVEDHSDLGVIDLTNDSVTNIRLARSNPVSEIRQFGGKLYIGEEALIAVKDGGVERFDAATLKSEGIVVEESVLGGDIVDIDIVSATLGLAIVGTNKTTLVAFDPSTGKKMKTILDPGSYTLFRLLNDPARGVFYVGDGDPHHPAVRVFDSATLNEKTGNRMAMPMTPYHLELTD